MQPIHLLRGVVPPWHTLSVLRLNVCTFTIYEVLLLSTDRGRRKVDLSVVPFPVPDVLDHVEYRNLLVLCRPYLEYAHPHRSIGPLVQVSRVDCLLVIIQMCLQYS